jgi:hypothetical protein
MSQIGRIETVALRDVWPNEAHDLTPWLLNNADALGLALGIDVELNVAEQPVGSFSSTCLGETLRMTAC